MSRRIREGSWSLQMPDEQVRRSTRIAEQPKKDYSVVNKRKAQTELQSLDEPPGPRKVKRTRKSKPPPSRAEKIDTGKKTKAQTRKGAKQANDVPESSKIGEKRLNKEKARSRPSTKKQPQRAARPSLKLPAVDTTLRQPPPQLSRAALRQLRNEIAKNPISEEIFQVMLFLFLSLLCSLPRSISHH